MKSYDAFMIGNITIDEIQEVDGTSFPLYGGSVLFGSYGVYAMGTSVGLLTKMTSDQQKVLDLISVPKEEVIFLESKENTKLVYRYITKSREIREVIVNSVADQIKISDIPEDIKSKIFHIGGSMYGEFEDGMIEELSKRGKVAVDLQAYLRKFDEKKSILHLADYEHKLRDMPFIEYLKADATEAEVITGEADCFKAAKIMYGWGAKEIMITQNTEIYLYDGEKEYTMPIRSRNQVGRTGRGDTAFAIYYSQRLTKSVEESLLWAIAAVSLKMEHSEPLKHTREDVKNYIERQYPEYKDLLTE